MELDAISERLDDLRERYDNDSNTEYEVLFANMGQLSEVEARAQAAEERGEELDADEMRLDVVGSIIVSLADYCEANDLDMAEAADARLSFMEDRAEMRELHDEIESDLEDSDAWDSDVPEDDDRPSGFM